MEDGFLGGPLGGVAAIVMITVLLSALVGGVLYQHEIAAGGRRLVRRLSPPVEVARGLPIERIAGDLRRVRSQALTLTPGTPMARRRGIWQAYDDLLVEAARALGVADTLSDLPAPERPAERLRVEHQLERAGLSLEQRPPYDIAG